jgi:hypothetical protein
MYTTWLDKAWPRSPEGRAAAHRLRADVSRSTGPPPGPDPNLVTLPEAVDGLIEVVMIYEELLDGLLGLHSPELQERRRRTLARARERLAAINLGIRGEYSDRDH